MSVVVCAAGCIMQPGAVEALLRALLRSTEVMLKGGTLVADVLMEQYQLEPDVALEVQREVVPLFAPDARASDEVIQRELSAYKEIANLSADIQVDDVVDFGPLQRAQLAAGRRRPEAR